MSHQYKAGDVVTVFQITPSKALVIEGKATIRKRVAEVDEQYKVEFARKLDAIEGKCLLRYAPPVGFWERGSVV